MIDSLRPGNEFPDFERPDQDENSVKLSDVMDGFPTAIVFSRGYHCPKDHRQLANYVEYLQPELRVNYCHVVVVSCDLPEVTRDFRDRLGATFPFLCDHELELVKQLDILGGSGGLYNVARAVPYTFVVDGSRTIHKIYNGYWYVGRPTVEELRMDYREIMSRRPNWWRGGEPPPYARDA